ncbi:hypothetical protein [Mammaliicoccus sciuri]|uniref:hypothetical protein n=1 Tax=Mammaliicoccus sciuri TaxID=1296 RepID=UPI001FB22619|nr:hypothetical protein [Mammaliicoccus sciuri]MCJ1780370.1 hypothetical protein [Mammaliicoccus sciuri]
MIDININIYTQGELLNGYNFLYDHGVELIAAIVTFLAFCLTFISILLKIKKDKDNEKKRNHKTLQMIDLITVNYREELKEIIKKINDIEKSLGTPSYIGDIPMYNINFEKGKSPWNNEKHETPLYKSYVIFSKFNYLTSETIRNHINSYDSEIKNLVSNHHLNLNNDSIDKISTKLTQLKNLKTEIYELDIKSFIVYESSYQDEIYKVNEKYTVEYDQKLEVVSKQINNIYMSIKDAQTPILTTKPTN